MDRLVLDRLVTVTRYRAARLVGRLLAVRLERIGIAPMLGGVARLRAVGVGLHLAMAVEHRTFDHGVARRPVGRVALGVVVVMHVWLIPGAAGS